MFVSSWGYDATYHDFYEVTEVIGKKRVKVKELATKMGKSNDNDPNAWTVRPIKHEYANDEEYTRNVLTHSKDPKKKDTYIRDKYTHSNAYYTDNPFDRDWNEDNYH